MSEEMVKNKMIMFGKKPYNISGFWLRMRLMERYPGSKAILVYPVMAQR
jgi:hypothetical protein